MTATAERADITLRHRIIDAAIGITVGSGWSAVTMTRLADDVGVSRQSVYNAVGAKPALAEAMVMRELDGFLAVVESAFDANDGDAVASVRAATAAVLERALVHPLLRAIVSATFGADTELLPFLATNASGLTEAASAVMASRLEPYSGRLSARESAAAVDVIVRVVLSHLMAPAGPPLQVADDLGEVTRRLLRL
jgi:AcrR family transcriptional regulator